MCAIYKSSKKSAAMPVRTSQIHNTVKILTLSNTQPTKRLIFFLTNKDNWMEFDPAAKPVFTKVNVISHFLCC